MPAPSVRPVLTTLITDDNHVPTTGYSKVKLINGMSGLQHPLSLAINFSPVADFVEVGKASDPFEFVPVASNQNQIDVTDANNLQSVLSRDTLTVLNGSVYTFFAAGGSNTGAGRREPGRDRHAAQGPLGRKRHRRKLKSRQTHCVCRLFHA